MSQMFKEQQLQFAEKWIQSWKNKDADEFLACYAEEILFISPFKKELLDNKHDFMLSGKTRLKHYFDLIHQKYQDTNYSLIDCFVGTEHLAITYQSFNNQVLCEFMLFNKSNKIKKSFVSVNYK